MALDILRRHRNSLLLTIPLVIVILGFIAFYIPSFQGPPEGSRNQPIGAVGDVPITLGEFQRSYVNRLRFYERAYQGQIDEKTLRAMGLQDQVFESLVGEKLVALEAERLGVTVADSTVARSIAQDPTLQRDGRFIGRQELRRLLDLQGISPEEFAEEQRRRLLADKLRAIVSGGATVSAVEAEDEFRRRSEQVKPEYVLVSADAFRSAVTLTEEDVRARFEARKDHYAIPERRVLSAIVVDPELLRSSITVSQADLERYYQEHRSEFLEPDEACASHILVRVKGEGEAEGHDDAEARRIAEDLRSKLGAGADFSALAKKSSEDKGSKDNGGDLGCFPRGRMVPEFDEAAFSLGEGQISELVKSRYGYHIIRLASRKAETLPALGAVKDRISQILLGERAASLGEEKETAILDLLSRGGSLEEAAKAQGLAVERSSPFARGETPAAPLAAKAVAARAFAMKMGETDSAPIRVGRAAAFISLSEIQPARAAQPKDVQGRVREDLLRDKTFALAEAKAREVRARATTAGLDKAASSLGLVRKETPALTGRSQPLGELGGGALLERAVFGLSPLTLSEPIRTNSGYAIVRVLEKKPFDPTAFAREKAAIVAQLTENKRTRLFAAFLQAARERHVVQQRSDLMRRSIG